ncbi:hypothetical protein [Peptostreptococcus porci]|uniref:hypothetical protein n=1 Tax=Peptostreptococcus porci TaxID=2652282 RepID=UPI0023EFC7D8|nr:hypothetical protein [Peptostreptococcus porci]MDD7182548.1 hypothetical protein [Peptostreptococcus porci]
MKYYNKNTKTNLTEQEYLALIDREAKDLYPRYLEEVLDDEEPMTFEQYKYHLLEEESDFEVIEE